MCSILADSILDHRSFKYIKLNYCEHDMMICNVVFLKYHVSVTQLHAFNKVKHSSSNKIMHENKRHNQIKPCLPFILNHSRLKKSLDFSMDSIRSLVAQRQVSINSLPFLNKEASFSSRAISDISASDIIEKVLHHCTRKVYIHIILQNQISYI